MRLIRYTLLVTLFLASGCGGSTHTLSASPTSQGISASPTSQTAYTAIPEPTTTATPDVTATLAATPTLGVGSTYESTTDGMVMVYVPAGPFTMGYDGGYPDEGPIHTVTLGAYWIDKIEIPNGTYEICVQAGACQPPAHKTSNGRDVYFGNPDTADYPVIFVNWDDARAYCEWSGGRLPTEAEWEKAARGTDGRIYPWGDNAPDKTLANFGNNNLDTTADGNYPAGASPYGALDMAGNVWEWTADWYGAEYYAQSPAENPTGPKAGTLKVLRGGSWNFDAPGARTTYRLSKAPTYVSPDVGFRCVRPASQ